MIDKADLEQQPLAQAETIPSAWYTDPSFDELDRKSVFERAWQYVGPASRVASPGAFASAEVAGNPIVVVRDRDATLRAFYNVCKHRGGPLVTADCGTLRMLQCQYHGWTYRLDGMLRGVPRFDRTELFDRRDYGLTEIEVALWSEMVFVRLNPPGDAITLGSLFDGIAQNIAPLRLDQLEFERRVTYDVPCNWKVYVDNYLEGYHLPLVHPELCDVLDYREYETVTFENYSLQHSPLQHDDTERAFYYFVYPNFMLNILPDRLQTNVVIPDGPDHCFVHFDYYYPASVIAENRATIEADQSFAEKVQQEDIDICRHVQRGLKSRAYDRGRFSYDAENGVHHFQCLLKRSYAEHLSAAGDD